MKNVLIGAGYLFLFAALTACDKPKQNMPATDSQSGTATQAPTTTGNDSMTDEAADPPTTTETTDSATTTPASAPETSTTTETKTTTAATPAPTTTNQNSDDDILSLARRSGCMACHKVEVKVVGPAWKDVAARYAGVATAKQTLTNKIKMGGKGNWTQVTGGIAMPPYSPRVSDSNITILVDFILSLK
ncbi:MAG: c-type cytochrome [Gammaproteobacteria bacterium]|nr:c-type cytochrome [Gammaproteobacteria bacterium]MDH5799797.1 c-type cytochrome [Gammaproteobacteria bacterium]